MANVPAGYVPLGLVGFTDQGDYNAESIYMQNDLVHVSNTIWKCKVDNTTGIAPAVNANWEVFVESGTDLAGIAAVDNKGVLGAPGDVVVSQALIDAIAQKVMTELLPYSKIVNNLLATDTNTALSGPMGKKLKEEIDRQNSDFKIGTMLKTMSFGYDGSTAFWVDFNIDGSKIDRIIFDNTEIRQAFTVDGGTTWTIIWSK